VLLRSRCNPDGAESVFPAATGMRARMGTLALAPIRRNRRFGHEENTDEGCRMTGPRLIRLDSDSLCCALSARPASTAEHLIEPDRRRWW
jgi:hypothetical protein